MPDLPHEPGLLPHRVVVLNEREYYVVDAFTNEPLAGNPAAVVLDATGLGEAQMQSIAAEFNLSETTFVFPLAKPEASVRFRWFTPATEVDLCGHATIAGVHALVESGRFPRPHQDAAVINIDTRSGILSATVEQVEGIGRLIWLDLPAPRLRPAGLNLSAVADALRVDFAALVKSPPPMLTQDRDAILLVSDVLTLNGLAPDFEQLATLSRQRNVRGWSVATVKTVSPSVAVQSRFFAPACGVNEDPVTGSVHGPLAAYLVTHGLVPVHDGLAGMNCLQSKAAGRTGLVRVLVRVDDEQHYTVRIAGSAVTTMKGQLVLPAAVVDPPSPAG